MSSKDIELRDTNEREDDELLGCQLCGAQLMVAGRIVCDDCRRKVEAPEPEAPSP